MQVTLLRNAYDNVGQQWEGDWSQFVELLQKTPTIATEKEQHFGFCPTFFRITKHKKTGAEGPWRCLPGAIALGAAVLDFDGVDPGPVEARAEALGASFFLYTTWRHTPEVPKFRIVIPLTTPVDGAQWEGWYRRLLSVFPEADSSVCDPSRYFIAPVSWGDSYSHDGPALDPARIWALPEVHAPARSGALWSRGMLATLGKKLSKTNDARKVAIGAALLLAAKGEPFAPPGERDNTAFGMAIEIAREFPYTPADKIAEEFRAALEVMNPGSLTVDVIREKIERKQREIVAELGAAEGRRKKRISGVFAGTRDTPYTPEEVAAWGDLEHRWLLAFQDDVWLFFDGSYRGPFKGKYADASVVDWLAPTDIPLETPTKDGWRLRTLKELLPEHGTLLSGLESSFLVPEPYYDAGRRVLVEAVGRRSKIRAKEHPEVHLWLLALGGEPLLDWLGVVTKLERAAPALLLCGAPGVGKSLLATGLGKLWEAEVPCSLDECLGAFNERMAGMPLVLGDEGIPRDFRGQPRTEELRRLVTSTAHELKRKHRPTTTVVGSLRIVIAVNDESRVFGTRGDFSDWDVDALGERFVFCTPDEDACKAALGASAVSSWADHEIAEHILWLTETRAVDGSGRLACPAAGGRMLDRLRVGSGLRWALMFWLDGWLHDDGARVRGLPTQPCIYKDGVLWIHPRMLYSALSVYYPHNKSVEMSPWVRACGQLADKKTGAPGEGYVAVRRGLLDLWRREFSG